MSFTLEMLAGSKRIFAAPAGQTNSTVKAIALVAPESDNKQTELISGVANDIRPPSLFLST
jgi:hypothetical protein